MMATPRTLGVCGVPGCYGPHVFCLSLSPFSWLRRLCAGMAAARLSRRVRRAVPRPAAPDGGAVPPSLRFVCLAAVNARLGANTVIWGFPVMVCLCGLVIEEGGDEGAGLRYFLAAAGQGGVVLGGADRQPVFFLPGRGVQPGEAGP